MRHPDGCAGSSHSEQRFLRPVLEVEPSSTPATMCCPIRDLDTKFTATLKRSSRLPTLVTVL